MAFYRPNTVEVETRKIIRLESRVKELIDRYGYTVHANPGPLVRGLRSVVGELEKLRGVQKDQLEIMD